VSALFVGEPITLSKIASTRRLSHLKLRREDL